MPCDTNRRKNQSLSERKAEIRKAIESLARGLESGRVKAVIGKQGAVTFVGATELETNRVTDACAYRQIMVKGSALAKNKIAKAEQIAGVKVNKQVIGQGTHSHDGGVTWHNGKG